MLENHVMIYISNFENKELLEKNDITKKISFAIEYQGTFQSKYTLEYSNQVEHSQGNSIKRSKIAQIMWGHERMHWLRNVDGYRQQEINQLWPT